MPIPPRVIPRPLTTRECADCLGVTTQFIREAIRDGHLRAERIALPGRRPIYRVHAVEFVRFLLLVKWTRLPPQFVAIAEQLDATAE